MTDDFNFANKVHSVQRRSKMCIQWERHLS